MRIKFILLTSLALVAALSLAPGASAKTRSIFVTGTYNYVDNCRPAPNQFRFAYDFKAKIKRKNYPLPSKVTVKYVATNAATGGVAASGTVSLTKRNNFHRKSPPVIFESGASMLYTFTLSYKAPLSGKKVQSKSTASDPLPSDADMDATNAAKAPAVPFPACV